MLLDALYFFAEAVKYGGFVAMALHVIGRQRLPFFIAECLVKTNGFDVLGDEAGEGIGLCCFFRRGIFFGDCFFELKRQRGEVEERVAAFAAGGAKSCYFIPHA